jgi:hypothetical protein
MEDYILAKDVYFVFLLWQSCIFQWRFYQTFWFSVSWSLWQLDWLQWYKTLPF